MAVSDFTGVYSLDTFDYSNINEKKKSTCAACGKLYEQVRPHQKFCKRDHYLRCIDCGAPVLQKPDRLSSTLQTRCRKCMNKYKADRTKQAMLDKYGVENILDIPEYRQKAVASINEKRDLITEKTKQTMKARYGGFGTASPVLRQKIENTMLERYGVTNPDDLPEFRKKISDRLKSEECQDKYRQSSMEHYGVPYPAQSDIIQEQMRKTAFEHYGVEYPSSLPEVQSKVRATCMQKFGVPTALMRPECVARAREAILAKTSDPKISSVNQAVADAIHRITGLDTEFELILKMKWYDIHVKGTQYLIEVDPSYTHSAVPNHWGGCVDADYHRMKSRVAQENGYTCIHLFDWDDTEKVVRAILYPRLRIYARQCKIKEIDRPTSHAFIEENHIQNDVRKDDVRLGLYYNGRLVQVMTFGAPRYTKKYQWELLRLCSASDVAVIGGASRLYSHFISHYHPESVISYCDRAKFTGSVYSAIGMSLDHTTEPAKVWSKGSDKITDNLLRQRGYDQLFGTEYGKGTDNEELMLENHWLPVYDCGQDVYVWHR